VLSRLLWGASLAAAGVGLFVCYLRQSRIAPVNSDGASNALQAWDMLHGNLLLHGWYVSDVSFYTTELPEYMLAESVRGLRPDVVHVCAALTYALLVLLAALLARGRARGREGVLRALLAAGIMLAPGISRGTYVVLTSPNHFGTAVPLLLTLLLLDRLPERWYVPVAICALLTWVQVADELATIAAAVPLALVAAVRASAGISRRLREDPEGSGGPPSRAGAADPGGPSGLPPGAGVAEDSGGSRLRASSAWGYDLALAVAAVASVALARVALAVIRSAGGYSQASLPGRLLATPGEAWAHLHVVAETVLLLFGADFFGQPQRLLTALALLHLAGAAAAAAGLLVGVCLIARVDRVCQVLVTGIVATLAAGVFSTLVTSLSAAHEIAVLLPFGAALAGRLLGERLARARRPVRSWLEPLLAVGLACYLAALCYAATWAPSRPYNQALAGWLMAHNLTSGLAGYWQANSTTLDSDLRVRVAPLAPAGKAPYLWESKASWFDPASSYANFVVTATHPDGAGAGGALDAGTERGFFGPPSHTYRFENYTIMVWDKNLLTTLTGRRGPG
jgi:hypothetical protein